MELLQKIALIVFSIIFIITHQFQLLILPFAFLAWLNREALNKKLFSVSNSLLVHYIVAGAIFGTIVEILAILNNLGIDPAKKALFHPDPFIDLVMGVGFYAAWNLSWFFAAKKFKYSVKEVLLLGGIFGIVVEQGGAILLSIFTFGLFGFVLWIYVLLVYGTNISFAFFVNEKELSQTAKQESKIKRYFFAFAFQLLGFVLGAIWIFLIKKLIGI